jgi:hypothetical protein
MSMHNHIAGFIGSTIAIPIVGQIPTATDSISQLATGTAQFILAVAVVVETCAIYRLFKMWRKDVEDDRLEAKADKEHLEAIIKESSANSAIQADSNKQLKEAVYHFSSVVSRCDHNQKERPK